MPENEFVLENGYLALFVCIGAGFLRNGRPTSPEYARITEILHIDFDSLYKPLWRSLW